MDLIAHRGFADDGVENALPTLVDAAGTADAVEFDVRLSRDGVPVVFHDERVDRLTAATGPVAAFDAGELTALTLEGTDATIPTLSAVLEAVPGRLVPELKVESVPPALGERLAAADGRVLVSSFRPAALEALPAGVDRALLVAPPESWEATVPAAVPTSMAAGIDRARALSAVAIHPHTSLCEAPAVTTAQRAGLAVNAWTIRSRETARVVRAAGVDGVIADSPRYVPDA